MSFEKRFLSDTELRIEQADGQPPKIVGYAALYNSVSKSMRTGTGKQFREMISPGAFDSSLNNDVLARYNHDLILGRSSAGTLKLSIDSKGLRYEITPTDSAAADHVVKSIKRGDVKGSSFAFRTIQDGWKMVDGQPMRELRAVDLIDVGPVDIPAYAGTENPDNSVAIRAEGIDETIADARIAEIESDPRQFKRAQLI